MKEDLVTWGALCMKILSAKVSIKVDSIAVLQQIGTLYIFRLLRDL